MHYNGHMKLLVKIPSNTDLLITPGQDVDFHTPFIRKKTTLPKTIPVANILRFEPEKIFMNLRKLVGEQLRHGDLVAEHKTVFSTKQYFSEVEGTITEINHMTGSIVIEMESEEQNQLNCFFKGEVITIGDAHLELKVKKYKEFDIKPIKQYFGAETFYIPQNTIPIITEDDVDNRFICAYEVKPFEQAKLEALGAVGLISPPGAPHSPALLDIVIQQAADFNTIMELQHPYCLIGEAQNTIYFYE